MDDEKLSPTRPQAGHGFAQAVHTFVTRLGDNLLTRMDYIAGTCVVYAQKLSPGVHRLWEFRPLDSRSVLFVFFIPNERVTASMGTLVD